MKNLLLKIGYFSSELMDTVLKNKNGEFSEIMIKNYGDSEVINHLKDSNVDLLFLVGDYLLCEEFAIQCRPFFRQITIISDLTNKEDPSWKKALWELDIRFIPYSWVVEPTVNSLCTIGFRKDYEYLIQTLKENNMNYAVGEDYLFIGSDLEGTASEINFGDKDLLLLKIYIKESELKRDVSAIFKDQITIHFLFQDGSFRADNYYILGKKENVLHLIKEIKEERVKIPGFYKFNKGENNVN